MGEVEALQMVAEAEKTRLGCGSSPSGRVGEETWRREVEQRMGAPNSSKCSKNEDRLRPLMVEMPCTSRVERGLRPKGKGNRGLFVAASSACQ
ncbi:hypothetical protein V6N11_080039 [Hibiscus sabdariffa]|uniref:Uncharacterized protein n=1 Tax=Hibiscus sabdariffa TaxID=183260 RepID=A0ABR2RX37_9ROSI